MACELLVTTVYVLAAAAALFAIRVRCNAHVLDVERHCLRSGLLWWYGVKLAATVVVVGGLLHARTLAAAAVSAAVSAASRLRERPPA